MLAILRERKVTDAVAYYTVFTEDRTADPDFTSLLLSGIRPSSNAGVRAASPIGYRCKLTTYLAVPVSHRGNNLRWFVTPYHHGCVEKVPAVEELAGNHRHFRVRLCSHDASRLNHPVE